MTETDAPEGPERDGTRNTDADSGGISESFLDDSSQSSLDEIVAIDFTPINALTKPTRRTIPLLSVVISVVLLVSGAILWFLLTARAVTINASPDHADLTISGGLAFSLSDHYLLRPGDYQLQISAEGYLPYGEALVVTDADRQEHTIELAKKPGHLKIVTTPAAAQVTVDGKLAGTTPLTIANLAPGDHQLLIEAQRYIPLEQSVDIEGLDLTQDLTLELSPGWGHMTFSSEPSGAAIMVAGSQQASTPASVTILASGELVEISMPGYKTWTNTLSVPIGEQQQTPLITLMPADGQLNISSSPAGASITMDGEYAGTTPATLELSPQSDHQLKLFLNGYTQVRRQVSIESGQQLDLSLSLKAKLGTLKITTLPTQANLYIDGKLRGQTPQSLTLPARPWKIEVRKDGYTRILRTITPKPGIPQALYLPLKTEQETLWARTPNNIKSSVGQQLKLFRPNTTFAMGSSRREQGRRANEILHDVKLTKPFYLSLTEVTNQQFRKFRKQHSSSHVQGNSLDTSLQPVVNISWKSAALFCNWLSQQDNLETFYIEENNAITGINPQAPGYRLPSEAEWAWAARSKTGGAKHKFPWGADFPPTRKVANIGDQSAKRIVERALTSYNDGYPVTSPVGSFPANSKGLYDMGGNVAEWVHDFYSISSSFSKTIATDPLGKDKGEFRTIRGASWRHGGISETRLAFRQFGFDAASDIGFRIARYAK